MQDDDRLAIDGALEQQTISAAKARAITLLTSWHETFLSLREYHYE